MGRFAYPQCSAGAPESSAIMKNNYPIHCFEGKQVDIAILHRKLGYLLNLDQCCVTKECLLFLSLKLTGERLGNRLKHFLKCVLDTSVLGTFMLTLPLYVPCMLSRVGSLYGLLYTYGCLRNIVVVISIISNRQLKKYKLTTSVAQIDWKISQMEAV